MHKKRIIFIYILLLAAVVFGVAANEARLLPGSIKVAAGDAPRMDAKPYIALSVDESVLETSLESGTQYDAKARLFGVIPIGTVEVQITEQEYVELCGVPIGLKMYLGGVIVAGTTDVVTDKGGVNPGELAGLRDGDIISKVGGREIKSALDLIESVEQSDGRSLTLTVLRDGKELTGVSLTPVFSVVDNCYRAGIWVRDSSAGIGILTFVQPDTKLFGGLGHAICDSESGVIMPISDGEITDVILTGVKPGARGVPGELIGYLGEHTLGRLTVNSERGVYGVYESVLPEGGQYPVAFKQEIREGKAQMLTSLPGATEPQLYDIVIEKINYDDSTPTRNMVIRVTDERLLEVSGGIVQGMSGSPILQEGKFVAAATHVFVNDPTKGYAIFAENMLDAAG
ncbi:MAG: SpoIVB peptidase [Clostridia bacterium]|nr:SpoIVB peptidase [Clostridia bacterium]